MCFFPMFFPIDSLQRNSLDIPLGETNGGGQVRKGIQGLKMTILHTPAPTGGRKTDLGPVQQTMS